MKKLTFVGVQAIWHARWDEKQAYPVRKKVKYKIIFCLFSLCRNHYFSAQNDPTDLLHRPCWSVFSVSTIQSPTSCTPWTPASFRRCWFSAAFRLESLSRLKEKIFYSTKLGGTSLGFNLPLNDLVRKEKGSPTSHHITYST